MRIGEVSKYLGLSPETIRYYEMEGLIRPDRNPGSSYRDYRMPDVLRLMAVQRYRSMGFSLKEVETIINNSDIEEQYRYVNTQYHILRGEMDHRRHLLDYLRMHQSELASAVYNVGNFWVYPEEASCLLPIAVWSKMGIRMLPIRDEDELSAWLSTYPYYSISLKNSAPGINSQIISKKSARSAPLPSEHLVCLRLSESDFKMYSLENTRQLIHLPAGTYLRTIRTFDLVNNDISSCFPDSQDLPDLHGLTVSGDAYGKILIASHDHERTSAYLEVQIPLTERRDPVSN